MAVEHQSRTLGLSPYKKQCFFLVLFTQTVCDYFIQVSYYQLYGQVSRGSNVEVRLSDKVFPGLRIEVFMLKWLCKDFGHRKGSCRLQLFWRSEIFIQMRSMYSQWLHMIKRDGYWVSRRGNYWGGLLYKWGSYRDVPLEVVLGKLDIPLLHATLYQCWLAGDIAAR